MLHLYPNSHLFKVNTVAELGGVTGMSAFSIISAVQASGHCPVDLGFQDTYTCRGPQHGLALTARKGYVACE